MDRPSPALPCAALAVLLTGCGGAPEEAVFEVIHDAARVRFRGDPAGVRLECEGCADTEPGIARALGGGRAEAVVRGLPEDPPATVRLRAGDEVVATRQLLAGPSALSGTPLLAGRDRVEVLVRRPCEVTRPEAVGGPSRSIGPVLLNVRERRGDHLEVHFQEEGLAFRQRFPWAEIRESSVLRLLEALAGVPEEEELEALHAGDAARRARQVATLDPSMSALTPWLPELLRGDLSLARRRGLFRVLQRFQRRAAFARALGLPGRVPGDDERIDSEPPNGFPPWPGAERRQLGLRPVGALHDVGGAEEYYLALPFRGLGSQLQTAVKTFRPVNAVTGVEATWPLDAPRSGAEVAVGLRVGHLVRETQLRLTAEAEDQEPLVVDLWHPSPALLPRPRFSGWVTARFPAEVAPVPGQKVRLELAPLYREAYKGNEVESLEVAWIERGTP